MRIRVQIDTDGALTEVSHEFGIEVAPGWTGPDEPVRRTEVPDMSDVAAKIAAHAVEIHRTTFGA
jgi:hypothetical protein